MAETTNTGAPSTTGFYPEANKGAAGDTQVLYDR